MEAVMTQTIPVSKVFAVYVTGRRAEHGPNNGARFRDQFLLPALLADGNVTVDLTGLRGKTPSFLDEAFGSLVALGFPEAVLKKRLTLVANDDDVVVGEAWQYVHDQEEKLALVH
jgi:hypothetical protein